MAESEGLLVLDGLDKSFPGVAALRDVSWSLRAGEVHGLVGENGAGKSTLVKVLTAPSFATPSNILNILVQISITTILAVGMTFVILVGGIDLSVGSVLALGTVIGAKVLVNPDLSVGVAVLVAVCACLGVGLLAGFVNGAVSERWAVPSFIVTLGMLNLARGASAVVSDNTTITGIPASLVRAGNTIVLGVVPVIFVIALATVLLAWFVLRYTVFGRPVYAVGDNEEAVRLSGHHTSRIKVICFCISGVTAGLAAIVFLLRLNVGTPTAAIGAELTAIAAVILGGTSLLGGRGSVIGSFLGACLLQVLSTGLQLLGVDDNFRPIVIGAVIVVAVVLDTYRERLLHRLGRRGTETSA